MKKIIDYHIQFFNKAPSLWFFLIWAALLAALFYGNYMGGWGEQEIENMPRGLLRYVAFLIYYAVPYAITLWMYRLASAKDRLDISMKKIMFPVCLTFLLLAFYTDFYYHHLLLPVDLNDSIHFFAAKCLANGGKAIITALLLWLILALLHVSDSKFYGLLHTKSEMKPYFILLLFMFPLIVIASFQADFMKYYPRFTYGGAADYLGVPFWVTQFIFQICYGLDFVAVELVFRGLMVVVLARYLGKSAVYGMVTIYFMLHFGKPAGEAISSIFGGFILGIIAFFSRSILGGVLIHLGVAWMMESVAWVQLLVNE